MIHCKASLVFGPGAGGGFGTVVDLEKVWDLIVLVCETLNDIDYRYLFSVEEDAFNAINQLLYKAVLYPGKTVEELIGRGARELNDWWAEREAGIREADALTKSILLNKAVVLKGRLLQINRLPPETIGSMLWILTETYVGKTHNPEQEQAIIELLSRIRRWRHMIETLEHMSVDGKKVNAMDSLNRINSFLIDKQQEDFNNFLDGLALYGKPSTPATRYAWSVNDSILFGTDKAKMLAAASSSVSSSRNV